REDERRAEKVCFRDGLLWRASHDIAVDEADGEFVGMMTFAPAGLPRIEAFKAEAGTRWRDASICTLLQEMVDAGLHIHVVDIAGEWAELNAPQDLARFVFGTKADTLERLSPLVRRSVIGEIDQLTVKEWERDRDGCVRGIFERFPSGGLAIR